MQLNTKINSPKLESHTSIDSLMIWLHKQSKEKEVLFGPARITTVMFNQISLLKVLDPLVSWPPSLSTKTVPLNPRQLTELSLDITDNGKREREPLLTQLLPFSHGQEDSLIEPRSMETLIWLSSANGWKNPSLKQLRPDTWPKISLFSPLVHGTSRKVETILQLKITWMKLTKFSRQNGRKSELIKNFFIREFFLDNSY